MIRSAVAEQGYRSHHSRPAPHVPKELVDGRARNGRDDRAVLQMLYAEEMSVAEIAEITGWSQSKVKIKAWRARNTLRRIVKKYL